LDFSSLYGEDYYKGQGADKDVSYYQENYGKPDSVQIKIRQLEFKGIEKTLLSLNPKGLSNLHLDFGGGLGGLVRHLNKNGFESTLLEYGWAQSVARELKTPISNGLKENFYDFVTAIEVLEHLINPMEALNDLCSSIKPGGYLIITTGNLGRHHGQIANWSYVKNNPDVHITYFTPLALSIALSKFGFEKTPVKFHSDVVLYKILKNLSFYFLRNKKMYFLKLLYAARWLIYPATPLADRVKGVSEIGVYRKKTTHS
jgi:2-polyprenyl-3-methyl-5-hydroxy-6-metoxy-1,4-benzoquinol methylase